MNRMFAFLLIRQNNGNIITYLSQTFRRRGQSPRRFPL
jgi:hypothetical protein